MQKIQLGTTDRTTTRLGYGCSGLMGAVGAKQSLALLETAFDCGIRHFDVAPMYGFGQAEECVGTFLRRHPADVTITTKYGIPAAKNPALIQAARYAARTVVGAFPGAKRRLGRLAGKVVRSNEKATFTADEAKVSLESSLKALRTDKVDVWLLHEVEAHSLKDESLLRFLEDMRARGTIGTFGVGCDRHKIEKLTEARPEYCPTLQFEWSITAQPVGSLKGFRIHHRALTSNFKGLYEEWNTDKNLCAKRSQVVGADLSEERVLSDLMLKAALIENPHSIILFSSKNQSHIRRNVEVAGDAELEQPARRLYQLVQSRALATSNRLTKLPNPSQPNSIISLE